MCQNPIFEASPSREDELLQTLVWIKKGPPRNKYYSMDASPFMIIINELGAVASEFLDPCYLYSKSLLILGGHLVVSES